MAPTRFTVATNRFIGYFHYFCFFALSIELISYMNAKIEKLALRDRQKWREVLVDERGWRGRISGPRRMRRHLYDGGEHQRALYRLLGSHHKADTTRPHQSFLLQFEWPQLQAKNLRSHVQDKRAVRAQIQSERSGAHRRFGER